MRYDELFVGQTAEYSKTVTDADVRAFAQLMQPHSMGGGCDHRPAAHRDAGTATGTGVSQP